MGICCLYGSALRRRVATMSPRFDSSATLEGTAQPCYAGAIVATYLEQSLTKLKEFEGCVPWMYRDTAGKLTVGVGLMLPDARAAAALPYVIGTRAATPEEIAANPRSVTGRYLAAAVPQQW